MTDAAIQIDALTRDFGAVRALDGLTLCVPAGRVFGFLGTNGAGKTTTIRLLLGLLEPTSGSARVLGHDTRTQGDEIRARTGALLEHAGLYERLSAQDNLRFYARIWNMPPAEGEARIKELLGHIGLWDRRTEAVGKWSRGMKQKLAVARTLIHRPDIVFLDEPTAGLDPVAAVALRDDLKALAEREGITIFLTTHNLPEAEKLCDLVAVISQGRLLAVGSPDELRNHRSGNTVHISARNVTEEVLVEIRDRDDVLSLEGTSGDLAIRLADGATAAPIVALLVQHDAEVEEVRRSQASLEDVFLALTQGEGT